MDCDESFQMFFTVSCSPELQKEELGQGAGGSSARVTKPKKANTAATMMNGVI
jgi:hypothetical protein